MGNVCCAPCVKAKATLDEMHGTINVIRSITDESQVVISDVKGFVGGIKDKTDELERLLVEDVKGVIMEIRTVLDSIPKMPSMPTMSTGDFTFTDYIPFTTSPTK